LPDKPANAPVAESLVAEQLLVLLTRASSGVGILSPAVHKRPSRFSSRWVILLFVPVPAITSAEAYESLRRETGLAEQLLAAALKKVT
jgi:hypothetical protein